MTKINKKWWILIAMTGSLSMIMIDQTIVTVTLPTIQNQFDISQTSLDWIINAYILALAVTVAVGGRVGDIIGRVKAFLFGTTLFALASAVCGIADSIYILLAARIVQGIAAAFMQPASAAIVNVTFKLEERGKAMAIYAGVAMAFMALGPLLGGFFTEYVSWRWSFFINIPIAICTIFMVFIVKPEDEIIKGQKIDITGAILLMFSAAGIVLGVQQGNIWGWTSSYTLSLIIGGLITASIFIFIEKRKKEPLINFDLLKNINFTVDAAVLFCVQFALIGQTVFLAIYMQNILGFGALNTGEWMLLSVVMIAIVSQFSGRLFDKLGVKIPAVTGLILIMTSYYFQGMLLSYRNILYIAPGMILLGIGIGCVMAPVNTDALNSVGRKLRGQASGLVQTARQLGGTIGIAVLFTVGSGLYSFKLQHIVEKAGKSTEEIKLLYGLLSKTPETQKDVALRISNDWQSIIESMKIAGSQSIALAYYVAGTLIFVSLIIAIFFMRSGKQTEETDF